MCSKVNEYMLCLCFNQILVGWKKLRSHPNIYRALISNINFGGALIKEITKEFRLVLIDGKTVNIFIDLSSNDLSSKLSIGILK